MNYQIEDKTTAPRGDHTIKMDNRKMLSMTGVLDVDGFDEHTIVLATTYGMMTVFGNELHISKLNVDEGCINIDGEVSAIQYTDTEARQRGGWLSKMFR